MLSTATQINQDQSPDEWQNGAFPPDMTEEGNRTGNKNGHESKVRIRLENVGYKAETYTQSTCSGNGVAQ